MTDLCLQLSRRAKSLLLIGTLVVGQLCSPLKADETSNANAASAGAGDSLTIEMAQSGTGRFMPNHWGMVKGRIANYGNHPATCLTVVTPEGSEGLQFARQLTIPPQVAFESNWPVYVHEAKASGGVEFQYLFFPNGEDDGVIRHEEGSKEIPSFSGITQFELLPLSGHVGDSGPGLTKESSVNVLFGVMRYTAYSKYSVTAIKTSDITADSECLDSMSQIAVTDSNLLAFPQACEALRAWTLRGGHLLIAVDQTGPAVVEALLGDSLPMVVVGETTANSVQLDINPEYSQTQYPVRSVVREYPEPVRYVRVIPDSCEKIWTVDGWPVSITKTIGRGTVLLTMISAEVFYERTEHKTEGQPDHALIASCRRMQDAMFMTQTDSVIEQAVAADQAAALIGYGIPSRRIAVGLLGIFPIGILLVGLFLQKRASGELLVFAVPCLSIIASLPAVVMAFQIRSVAPATVIESVVINSSKGFTDLPADGFASVYAPSPGQMSLSTTNGTRLEMLKDPTSSDYRRMTWRGPGEISWENFHQPVGLRTFSLTSERQLRKPLRIHATLNEDGLTGILPTDGELSPSNPILAGMNRENMALRLEDSGNFAGTADDALLTGQYFQSSLLSDEERYRTALLDSVFHPIVDAGAEVFPPEPSVLFWDESEAEVLHFEEKGLRRQKAVLFIHPLELYPPEPGKTFVIPPQLLTYRSIVNSDGGIGSSYANLRRKWQPQESASKTMLEFQIPEACRPMFPESGELKLLIRAGSRFVTVLSGDRDRLQPIAELKSPLGMQTIFIPGELIRNSCQQGHLFLEIQVSEISSEMKAEDMTGEQDDSWKIERVLLELKGQRKI